MTSAAGLLTRASSRLAAVLPERLTAGAIRAVYPRVEPELARLASFAPAGGTAVDVGAWYGPWTARLRRIADRVVAVEPNAQLADCVQAAFPDVRVVRAVVSDHTGQAELHLPAGGPAVGTSSIEYGDGPSITVPRTTIDALGLTDVRFVKLDVEGHELPALRGAAETIQRDSPTLLVEVEERIQPVEPIVDLLRGWGYRGFVLPDRDWLPLDGFDLIGHQRDNLARVRQSFARRVLLPRPRYVNSVLFRKD
ncbi:FkbM family methyltransferase [Solwaraspora sp. WMMD1047]|uniref:FkbM family methyltransferase n=1 Tax=Solwaraspora sp. WMMD1047 TaxID=3016102 RepID=UPI0024173D21|nr:FkbM family methyltransferase [Solwaraspora sp. WMMD1047]MDG4834058.1 FkbM family methyltransferase [Solwaraspora sp. WMMD1047]